MITAIPKLGRHISTSIIVEKFKVVGSVARTMLRKCADNGSLKCVEAHSRQTLYTPTTIIEKAPEKVEGKETKKEKGKKK